VLDLLSFCAYTPGFYRFHCISSRLWSVCAFSSLSQLKNAHKGRKGASRDQHESFFGCAKFYRLVMLVHAGHRALMACSHQTFSRFDPINFKKMPNFNVIILTIINRQLQLPFPRDSQIRTLRCEIADVVIIRPSRIPL